MDESTIESIRHRVPMLDGEFYSAWKSEMLEIFNEYNLNNYITSPCVPPIDPLYPTCRGIVTADVLAEGLSRGAIATRLA